MKITYKRYWLGFILILGLAFVLRFVSVTQVPPSPYWEEVAIGYDAYSLVQTGKDHHGNPWPLVAFESFGDWKPSLYFYAVALAVKVLGMNLLAVRLPSVIAGVIIVAGVAELTKGLFLLSKYKSRKKENTARLLSLTAATMTAISPWALLFSRAGWEVNLATVLTVWAGVFSIKAKLKLSKKTLKGSDSKVFFLMLSGALFFSLSMYAYHAARLSAPLLGLFFVVIWIKDLSQDRLRKLLPRLLVVALVSLVLISPILFSAGDKSINNRFQETSIFSNLDVIKESNLRKERAGNTLLSRIIYHRYILYSREIFINFLDHSDFSFLFLSGDENPRHSVQYYGQLYHIEIVFLLAGIYALVRWRGSSSFIVFFWYALTVFPAAVTKTTPHSLRILPALPVILTILSFGLLLAYQSLLSLTEKLNLFKVFKKWVPGIIILVILAAYSVEFVGFWRYYQGVYPKLYADEWQYGYQEMIGEVINQEQSGEFSKVYISREMGRPAMYYWFYSKTDPREVQKQNDVAHKDQGEFLTFNDKNFFRSISEIEQTPALVASTPRQLEDIEKKFTVQRIKTIYNLQHQPIWQIYSIQ